MNIRRGLHRIAILIISCMSFFYFLISATSDWSRYQYSLSGLNSIQYVFIPKENTSGWSFEKFEYQKAIHKGYSDQEIVEFLSQKYNDFNLKRFKKEAKTVKIKNLCSDFFNSFRHSLLILCGLYSFVFVFYFLMRWVISGFGKEFSKK